MAKSAATDVFHSTETAGLCLDEEPLGPLLDLNGTSAGANGGAAADPAVHGGTKADPGRAELLLT